MVGHVKVGETDEIPLKGGAYGFVCIAEAGAVLLVIGALREVFYHEVFVLDSFVNQRFYVVT